MTVGGGKLEGVWKEVVMASVKVASQYLPGGTEENKKILGMDKCSWVLNQDLPHTKEW